MPFKKGEKGNGGRREGSVNFSTSLRNELKKSFEQAGKSDYLLRQAKENPKAYMAMLTKVLPSEEHIHTHDVDAQNLEDLIDILKAKVKK